MPCENETSYAPRYTYAIEITVPNVHNILLTPPKSHPDGTYQRQVKIISHSCPLIILTLQGDTRDDLLPS